MHAARLVLTALSPRRALVVRSMTSSALTPEQRFEFDLNGYFVLRKVLSQGELAEIHSAIDAHKHEGVARASTGLRNAVEDSAFGAAGVRTDLGGILGWEEDCMRKLVAHPRLAPYLSTLVGAGYRLDHQPLVLIQQGESEGFSLHGGPLSGDDGQPEGVFNPELQYRCVNGQPWNSL